VNYVYEELAPPAALSRWVAAFWQLRDGNESSAFAVQRVLPDGCVDILFDFGQWNAGTCSRLAPPAARLIGTMTRAIVVPLSGPSDLFGIRFRPGVIGSLMPCPGRRVQDLSVTLADVKIHLPVSDEQLYRAESLAARANLVSPGLEHYLATAPARDRAVLAAMAVWNAAVTAATGGLPSVSMTARSVGVSERSLERRFSDWVGYRPAQFRRLVRFRAALRLSGAGSRPWSEVAARSGYADQSHLSRDFSEFALTTPGGWTEEQRAVGFVQDSSIVAL
jgi:AraC-like DNA-binding protein